MLGAVALRATRAPITLSSFSGPDRLPPYRGPMLRDTLLYLSNRPRVFRFVRNNRMAKHFASRFVAGETLAEALTAVRALNARGITASLDLLGESVNNEREARAARDEYLTILKQIHDAKIEVNVSVKLTAMGLDIDQELCVAVMQDILARAQQYDAKQCERCHRRSGQGPWQPPATGQPPARDQRHLLQVRRSNQLACSAPVVVAVGEFAAQRRPVRAPEPGPGTCYSRSRRSRRRSFPGPERYSVS